MLYNNYMKKTAPVCVIGGPSIDIFGTASQKIVPEDSNIGQISFAFGGVGRNIANNLAKLGIDVELVCVTGNDDYAEKIIEHCKKEGIGLNYSESVDQPTATYLSINQPEGDIYVSINDMEINKCLNIDFLSQRLDFINSCPIVVMDTNLSAETLAFMLQNVRSKIYFDPVSSVKAALMPKDLTNISVLKPNVIEAETILHKKGNIEELVNGLLYKGIKEVYLTLGKNGAYSANEKEHCQLPIYPGEVINTTGCGDAFLAGVIYGDLHNQDLFTKTKYGLAAASISCRSLGSNNEYLNETELLKTAR